jgi:LEA14-like dessication related protein
MRMEPMKMKTKWLVLLILAGSLSSCVQVEPLTVGSVLCCEIKKVSKDESEVGITIKVNNPNTFPIFIQGYDLDLRVNGNVVGNVKDRTLNEIPAASSLEKTIFVTTSTQTLVNGAVMMGLNALFSGGGAALEIEVAGTVEGRAKGMSRKVKINEKYPLKLQP